MSNDVAGLDLRDNEAVVVVESRGPQLVGYFDWATYMNPDLDENLLTAMRVAREHQSAAWKRMLAVHRDHPSFTTVQDPMRREIGFACLCAGERQEFRISLKSLKEMLPDARTAVSRAFENLRNKGSKARKRKAFKARMRARALLYKYLTKEQKWSLRGGGSFFVTGKDGHTYEIRTVFGNNVIRYEDGKPVYQFCVISKYDTPIPIFDLLLGQKLMLETDPRSFLDIAVVKHIPSGETWKSGRHIDNPEVEPPPSKCLNGEGEWHRDGDVYWHQDDLEHQQALEIRRRRDIHFGVVGDLLVHDVCLNEEARYDASLSGLGFVLNGDLDVVPTFDIPFIVPPVENTETDACIIKLITGVPAEVYPSIAHVQEHFAVHDLCGINVLLNPETDALWSERVSPTWNRHGTVLGVKKILDERVPKGRAWYVADAETVGVVTHWYDEPKHGYSVFNLNGVAIYEPPNEEVQEESQATHQESSSQEGNQENCQEGISEEAQARQEIRQGQQEAG